MVRRVGAGKDFDARRDVNAGDHGARGETGETERDGGVEAEGFADDGAEERAASEDRVVDDGVVGREGGADFLGDRTQDGGVTEEVVGRGGEEGGGGIRASDTRQRLGGRLSDGWWKTYAKVNN